MLRPRFEAVSLRYGCHNTRWELDPAPRPVVITGPNGSGKTTLVDGMVRTLFGFDRRRAEDADRLAARQPWEGGEMLGRVVLARNGDRIEICRDFSTDLTRVHDLGRDVERFAGSADPAAHNQAAHEYRQIMADLLGIRDLTAYRQTLYIRQGQLASAAMGDHLLRVASGGHSRVEAARHQIASAHRDATRRPIHSAAVAAINPRELEKLDEQIESVRARLDAARAAGERRAPLALERDRIAERLERIDEEIVLLESARSALARTDVTELSTRQLRQQMHDLEEAGRSLSAAVTELEAAAAAHDEAFAPGEYPQDVPQRMARAEIWWNEMEDMASPPAPWLGGLAFVLLLAGAVLLAIDYDIIAAIVAGAGVLIGSAWAALWLWSRRRRRSAGRKVRLALKGVPDAEEPDPDTRRRAVERYNEQQVARARMKAARGGLAEALLSARSGLRAVDHPAATAVKPTATDPGPITRARGLIEQTEAAAREVRNRLAIGRTELDRIGDLSLALPGDVAPTEDAVAAALQERRADRSAVQESLRDVSQELLERGTPGESVAALETLLASLEERRRRVGRKADVLEAAHALLLDAYDDFRDHDQGRLTDRVSDHVRRLSGGQLEGVEVEESLDDALVRTRGRAVAMTSPPLSFGEFHTLQLGVRLGAAEFLGGLGVLPPLIIDEPFAHLDARSAEAVWHQLTELAEERQVLVTTQDDALLEAWGVEPDIRLG